MLVAQSCPSLRDPVDFSLPGSSVHRSLQVRMLEWVAISFSRGSSWPRNWNCLLSLLDSKAGSLPLVPPGKGNKCSPQQWPGQEDTLNTTVLWKFETVVSGPVLDQKWKCWLIWKSSLPNKSIPYKSIQNHILKCHKLSELLSEDTVLSLIHAFQFP